MTLGVAAAVSVLAGALVVGDSVRGSLRDIALGRLGRTDQVLSSMGFFREGLSDDVKSAFGATDTAPLIVADAFVTLESSGRRASNVIVYGVDERFWKFQGLPPIDGVMVSPALAAEVGAKDGDVLLTRLQKPSEIPIESLFGRKEDVGRTVRLTLAGVLARDRLGEFALRPQQADVRAVFAPLRRLQRDLAVNGQVNTVLVSGGERSDATAQIGAATRGSWRSCRHSPRATPPSLSRARTASSAKPSKLPRGVSLASWDLQPIPVFTYLANSIRKGDRQIPYSLVTATDLGQVPAVAGAAGADSVGDASAERTDCGGR